MGFALAVRQRTTCVVLALVLGAISAGAQRAPVERRDVRLPTSDTDRSRPTAGWRMLDSATRAHRAGSDSAMRVTLERRLAQNASDALAALGLAALARHAHSWSEADSLRTIGHALASAERPDALTVDVTGVRAALALDDARQAANRGHYRAATAAGEQAAGFARATADSVTLADALLELSTSRGRAVSRNAALATWDTIQLVLGAAAPSTRRRAECVALGLPGGQTQRERINAGTQLAAQFEEADPGAAALCHFIVAQTVLPSGDQATAFQALFSAERLYTAARETLERAAVRQWMGHLYLRAGQIASAERVLAASLHDAAPSNNVSQLAWIHLNLADAARQRAMYTSARESLALARSLAEAATDHTAIAAARTIDEDLSLAIGDWRAVETATEQRWRGAGARADSTATRHAAAARRADVAVRRGQLEAAQHWVRLSDSLAPLVGAAWQPLSDAQVGWVALRSGQADTAKARLSRARAGFHSTQPGTRYALSAQLAEAHLALGQIDSAERVFAEATQEFARWRAEQPTNRLRALAARRNVAFGGARATASPEAVIVGLALGGRSERAFAFSESLRARTLLDAVAAAQSVTDSALTVRAMADALEPTTASALQRAIPDAHTAVVSYAVGRAGLPTLAFVITRDTLQLVTLSSIDLLAPLVARVVALLSDPAASSDDEQLQRAAVAQLGDTLIAAVVGRLPAAITQLVIIPDDVLHRVPFAALEVRGAPLLDRFTVTTVPSASVAQLLWSRTATPASRVLVIADPTAPPSDDASVLWRDALPGARQEARDIQRVLPVARVSVGDAANEGALPRALTATPGILHIASHALVDDQTVDGGLLVLAPHDGHDGFVTPLELSRLVLTDALVVLSACRTARGPIIGGEGVRGLVPPLLGAGASAVILTQWDISDRGVTRVIAPLYSEIARGVPVAEALAAAQRSARDRGIPMREWAGLTLVGNGQWRYPVRAVAR